MLIFISLRAEFFCVVLSLSQHNMKEKIVQIQKQMCARPFCTTAPYFSYVLLIFTAILIFSVV